jgi:hypothetical protein
MTTIYKLGDEPAIGFASSELARYIRKMTGQGVTVKRVKRHDPRKAGIWLGVVSSFSVAQQSHLAASRWDDGYTLQHDGAQLRIQGTNGRSVLYGVYDYLDRLGVRWVRPGENGEIIPNLDSLPSFTLDVKETASYRHRGVCIEGAPSLEHALNMVDWMAKHRMNSFFLQFRNSGTFWERWYSRAYNPQYGVPQHLSEADFIANDQAVIASIKKRGLLLHQVGHGWTAATLDMPTNGWQKTELAVVPEKKRWLAKVAGKRALFHNTPINTELCYSHRPAFKTLVANITAYTAAHPEIDVLHVWLSDAMNNKCECDACSVMSPSDWYVKLVNALSEELYHLDPEHRFVFLSYFESWWAPEKQVVDTTRGNAILMFAPISRCFRHALTDTACASTESLGRPPLNAASMPRSNQSLVALLDKWWDAYSGDSFLFDYYLWSGLHTEASDLELARIIHKDMRALKGLRLNGFISCQVLRSFWPTGLPMIAMAETMWNRQVQWKTLKNQYLEAAYGPDYAWVDQYLHKLEKMMLGRANHDVRYPLASKQPKQLRAIEAYLAVNHIELYARAARAHAPAQQQGYIILVHHNQFLLMLCQAALGKLTLDEVKTWLLTSEKEIHPYLDVPTLISMQLTTHP